MAETGRRNDSLSITAGRVVFEGAIDGVEVPEVPFVWGISKGPVPLA